MPSTESVSRTGEYAARGDYHRELSPDWVYYPTYLAKLERVRAFLNRLPATARVLDAGCGEGVIVEEFAERLQIEGIDSNYSSPRVRTGSLMALPFDAGTFSHALCLDVLEHLPFDEQPKAIAELHRVLRAGGELLVTVPNLAHLQSRIKFVLTGRLVRTANPLKHPGDRPLADYVDLARQAGFIVVERSGIFPTVPVLTRLIRRYPSRLRPLHDLLTRVVPVAGWCFLGVLRLRKP